MFFDQEKSLADLGLGRHCILSKNYVQNEFSSAYVMGRGGILRSLQYTIMCNVHLTRLCKSIMTIMIIMRYMVHGTIEFYIKITMIIWYVVIYLEDDVKKMKKCKILLMVVNALSYTQLVLRHATKQSKYFK